MAICRNITGKPGQGPCCSLQHGMQLRGENNWNPNCSIRAEADYKATLKDVSTLMDSDPDPVEAIKFRMDQSGLTIKDLEPIIGKSNRVYEVLNRKRPLTLAMIRRLHHGLGIPADALI